MGESEQGDRSRMSENTVCGGTSHMSVRTLGEQARMSEMSGVSSQG